MNNLLKLNLTLTSDDRKRLSEIFAPTVVGVQPEDSRRGLVVMPDGELRSYGVYGKKTPFDQGKKCYISSRNCGLDWSFHYAPDTVLGAAAYLPWSGKWVTVISDSYGDNAGTYALISDIGPDDASPNRVKISDKPYIDMFQPEIFEDKHRIICCGHIKENNINHPVVMYSDNDGECWKLSHLTSTPKHEAIFPHLGTRWQNTGSETTFTRLSDGRLMMLARTSLDFLYVYYSCDLGESWTEGEPSNFHCTLTTPFLLKLHDGRTVLFWNNTHPLAERNHETEWPPVSEQCKAGIGEDVFTNRDAAHAAISDNCENWIGFREIALNEIRNAADYRSKGGCLSSADKSVQQFQAIELPEGKILVEYGQHEISRKIIIFDINWLYERERSEDWQRGLENVSTHLFVKSISDCHIDCFAGHCAWNRTNGALLVPDPDATYGEGLQICRVNDKRLVSELQGMVWNFPSAEKGELTLEIRIVGAGIKVSLCDHWINPSDRYVQLYRNFGFELNSHILQPNKWVTVRIIYDCKSGNGKVFVEDTEIFGIEIEHSVSHGVSYLHLQTMAESTDFDGTLVRNIKFRAL